MNLRHDGRLVMIDDCGIRRLTTVEIMEMACTEEIASSRFGWEKKRFWIRKERVSSIVQH